MSDKKPPFKFLSLEEFALLHQDQKIAYLTAALPELFSDGKKPPDGDPPAE